MKTASEGRMLTKQHKPRIGVVGRGIAGMAVAFRLVEAGYQVVVVGPKVRPGSASVVAQGVSAIKGLMFAHNATFALKLAGHRGLPAWLKTIEQASGCTIPHQFQGVIEPFTSFADYRRLRQRIYHHQFTGCFGVQVHKHRNIPEQLGRELLQPQVIGALHYSNDGWYSPNHTLAAIEVFLQKQQTRFYEHCLKAVRFSANAGVKLITTGENLDVDDVILAAGMETSAILQASGWSHLQFKPVFGQNLLLNDPAITPACMVREKQTLLATVGSLSFGATTLTGVQTAEAALLSQGQKQLLTDLQQVLGGALPASTEVTSHWGVRARSVDRLPVVGMINFAENRRIFVASGFYKNGLQVADLCAQGLVAALRDQPVSPLLQALQPSRLLSRRNT